MIRSVQLFHFSHSRIPSLFNPRASPSLPHRNLLLTTQSRHTKRPPNAWNLADCCRQSPSPPPPHGHAFQTQHGLALSSRQLDSCIQSCSLLFRHHFLLQQPNHVKPPRRCPRVSPRHHTTVGLVTVFDWSVLGSHGGIKTLFQCWRHRLERFGHMDPSGKKHVGTHGRQQHCPGSKLGRSIGPKTQRRYAKWEFHHLWCVGPSRGQSFGSFGKTTSSDAGARGQLRG